MKKRRKAQGKPTYTIEFKERGKWYIQQSDEHFTKFWDGEKFSVTDDIAYFKMMGDAIPVLNNWIASNR